MLMLKEKSDERVVYYYSSDVADFGGKIENIISDGEIEFLFVPGKPETLKYKTLKTATFDDDGFRAKWIAGSHIYRIIFKENCPEKRFFATG